MVELVGDEIVVQAPAGGYNRAWGPGGAEIYIGPESGPDAQ
jgi:hypothetical protein